MFSRSIERDQWHAMYVCMCHSGVFIVVASKSVVQNTFLDFKS